MKMPMNIFEEKLSMLNAPRLIRLGAAALSCAALAAPALAQQVLGTLSGSVSDAAGAIIANAAVTVHSLRTGLSRTGQSGANGQYEFHDLPSGPYSVEVTAPGFETQRFPSVLVQGDRTASLPAKLAAGSVNTTVTVNGTPLLNQTDTTNGYVLDHGQVQDTPLATGSFTQLAVLAPGVSADLINGVGTNEGLGNQNIFANGQRSTDNVFLVDGVDVSNLFSGDSSSQVPSGRAVPNTGEGQFLGGAIQTNTSVYDAIGNSIPTPSPEQIDEVRVNASMYDAQQGAKSGAHIDVGTIGGSNRLHGQAYATRATNAFNAAPFFRKQESARYGGAVPTADVNPYLHRVVAGGTLGGPLVRDKLFGFAAYNGTRITDLFNGTSNLYLPSGLTDDRSAAGIANAINSTEKAGTAPFGGTLNPAAVALLQYKLPNGQYLIPSPTADAAALLAAGQPDLVLTTTPSFKADEATGSLDAILRSTDVLSFKYLYQHDPAVNPFTDSDVNGFDQHLDSGSQLASIVNSWTPSSRLSWQQSFGFVREKAYSYNQESDQALTPQAVGINLFGYSAFPGLSISDVNGGAVNAALRIGPTGSFTNDGLFQNSFQPRSVATATLGRHTVSAGGNFSYTQLDIRNRRDNTAEIDFSSFPNFAEGNVRNTSSFLQGVANRYYRAKDIGGFVQDKWQVRNNVSLTAGIRYDYDGPLTEKYGNFFNFEPALYSYDSVNDTITNDGFIIAGNNKLYATPGVSSSTLRNRQDGISPRVGFAWTPAASNNSIVFRGGFGMYFNRGEYFTYLSPGAGSGISGPFGVTQEPPFVIPVSAPRNATLTNPFGAALPTAPNGNPAAFTTYLPNRAGLLNGDQTYPFGSYNIDNKLPYTENWSFDFQWQPINSTSVQVGYVGNRGRHGVIPIPFNQPGIATPTSPINGETYSYGYQAVDENGNNLTTEPESTYDGGNTDLRTPYLGYSANSVLYEAAGNSAYDALQVQVQKRMTRGLRFVVNYTWSHSLDEQSGVGLFYNGSNPLDLRSGYASSDFDRTNVITFNYLYDVPRLVHSDGLLGKVVNGFELTGLTVLQSGQPYSVEDYSGAIASQYYSNFDAITNPIIPLAPGTTPKQALTGHSGAFSTVSGPALNPSAFTIPFVSPGQDGVPPCGVSTAGAPVCDVFENTFGPNGQRNIFRQAFQKRADVSVVKRVRIGDRLDARYSFDVFNVTNTPSFDIPNNSISTAQNIPNTSTNPSVSLNSGQIAYNPAVSTIANRQTVYNIQNNGVNVSGTSGLGLVQNTIGSMRVIEMTFRLQF